MTKHTKYVDKASSLLEENNFVCTTTISRLGCVRRQTQSRMSNRSNAFEFHRNGDETATKTKHLYKTTIKT